MTDKSLRGKVESDKEQLFSSMMLYYYGLEKIDSVLENIRILEDDAKLWVKQNHGGVYDVIDPPPQEEHRDTKKGEFVYHKVDGDRVLYALSQSGISAEIIGTLPSNHDIDVLIKTKKEEFGVLFKSTIFNGVLNAIRIIHTDLGSYFVLSMGFGHVEVFFEDPRSLPDYKDYIRRKESILKEVSKL